MSANQGSSGVSKCYVFKAFLHEYAQKVGLPAPIYETSSEGPHDSSFRSTVIVNGVRYDSIPGFSDCNAAEQSASEVALIELAKSDGAKKCVPLPFYEVGGCKILLQEYAEKMKYAAPVYEWRQELVKGRGILFTFTIEIGGMIYVGAAAKTKKEAEMKATRTALLTIQSCSSELSGLLCRNSELTVLPRGKGAIASVDTPKALKPQSKNKKKKRASRGKGMATNNIVVQSVGNVVK